MSSISHVPKVSGDTAKVINLKDIASKMAGTGKAKEALKTAWSIQDPKETAKGIEMLYQLWLKPLQTVYPLPVIQGGGK